MKRFGSTGFVILLLALVLLFNLAMTPGFFELQVRDGRLYGSLVDIFNRGAPVAILAAGMTFVIATGGVDLSVGAVMAIAGAVVTGLIVQPAGFALSGFGAMAIPAAAAVALALAVAFGSLNGVLVGFFRLQPIVATLLLMVAGRGVAQLLTNGQIITVSNPAFATLAGGATLGLPNPIWIAVLVFVLFGLLARGTAFGLFVEATGDNASAARLVGIDERTLKLTVYALSGLCAGLAGLIAASDIRAADANNAGLYLELDAILAVALGGTAMTGGRFNLAGTLAGAMLMQTVTTTVFTRGVATEWTLVLKALIVVLVCVLQSPVVAAMRPRRAS